MRYAAPGSPAAARALAPVRSGRLPRLLVALVLLAGLAASCKTYDPGIPPDMSSRPRTESVPDWVGQPLSWNKLADIQAWQSSEGDYASDFWRIEAELELARGRLEFALQDRATGARDSNAVRNRLGLARQGFQSVLNDAMSTREQDKGARSGLDAIERLNGPRPKTTSTVLARASWGAMQPRPSRLTRATGRWTKITVHHSAEAYGPVLDGTARSSANAIRRIQQHMMNGLDYGDIGYHYLIDPQGRVFVCCRSI